MWKPSVLVVVLVALGGTARADVVHLADGGLIEGAARREGQEVVVQVDGGELRFSADQVLRIVRQEGPIAELRARRRALPAEAVGPRLTLARWAAGAGLEAEARALYREVLALDADEPHAHRALGHEKVDGRWLDEAAARRARGFVRHEGAWVAPETVVAEEASLAKLVDARREREATAAVSAAARAAAEAAAAAKEAARAAEAASRVQTPWTPWVFGAYPFPGQTRLGPRGPTGMQLGLRTRAGAPGGQVVFGPLPRSGRAPQAPVPAPRSPPP